MDWFKRQAQMGNDGIGKPATAGPGSLLDKLDTPEDPGNRPSSVDWYKNIKEMPGEQMELFDNRDLFKESENMPEEYKYVPGNHNAEDYNLLKAAYEFNHNLSEAHWEKMEEARKMGDVNGTVQHEKWHLLHERYAADFNKEIYELENPATGPDDADARYEESVINRGVGRVW